MTTSFSDIESLRLNLSNGTVTVRAVTEAAVDAAENLNNELNAFLQIDREGALARASEVGESTDSNQRLRGIPIALKDNICVQGLQASCGSPFWELTDPLTTQLPLRD